jgi:hypothetical protein
MSGEREPFTRVWAGMLAALTEANVSGKELVVLISLLRYQKDGDREIWRPVSEIATECGLSESNVRNKLTSLTRKAFTGSDGFLVPVITRVREGHRGRATTYVINLPRESATDTLPNANHAVGANQRKRGESATFSAESATNPALMRNKVVAPLEPIERINRKDMVDFGKSTAAFPSKNEWVQFVEENGLPEPYGDEYERLKDRGWTDGEGNPIHDWRAYLLSISKKVNESYEQGISRSSEYDALSSEYPF